MPGHNFLLCCSLLNCDEILEFADFIRLRLDLSVETCLTLLHHLIESFDITLKLTNLLIFEICGLLETIVFFLELTELTGDCVLTN